MALNSRIKDKKGKELKREVKEAESQARKEGSEMLICHYSQIMRSIQFSEGNWEVGNSPP